MRTIYRSAAGREALAALYAEVLQRWPLPVEALEVSTHAGHTRVWASGPEDAPPVVLLHGTATNSAMWMGEVSALVGGDSTAAHRVLCVDIPGEPGQSADARMPMAGDGHGRWLLQVLDALALPRVALVGCSLGGLIALQTAASAPGRVSHLALLCPGGVVAPNPWFVLRALPLTLLGDWGAARINAILYAGAPVDPDAARFGALVMRHMRPRLDPMPLLGDQELARLTMPVLAVAGDRDALIPGPKAMARLARQVPHAQIHLIPGAGHVLLGQGPRLARFLEAA